MGKAAKAAEAKAAEAAQTAAAPPPYSEVEPADPYNVNGQTSPYLAPPTPNRASDESSTARSEYLETEDTFITTRGAKTKVLDVFHAGCYRDYRIYNPDGSPLYYVDNSEYTPEVPDVTLISGEEKTGRVLGVGKFSTCYSKNISLCLGDPKANGGREAIWYMMERSSSFLTQNEFKINIRLHPTDPYARTFVWKRSSRKVVGDEAAPSFNNFKMIDGANAEIVATFANNGIKSWKKKGKFRVVEGVYGPDFEKIALLTLLCLIERSRRRERHARRAGGGGGP